MAPTNGSLAQSVEQLAFNQLVAGSNPARPTISFLVSLFQSEKRFAGEKQIQRSADSSRLSQNIAAHLLDVNLR